MKIIAFDKVSLSQDEKKRIEPLLKSEAETAWELYKQGYFRELYFRTDYPGAVIILECESIDEAKVLINKLPLVKNGIIEFEFIPVGPFLPFENLFEKN